VRNSFAKRNFIRPTGWPNHALRVPWFEGRGGGWWEVGGDVCLQAVFGVDTGLSMQVLLGRPGGRDLFSF